MKTSLHPPMMVVMTEDNMRMNIASSVRDLTLVSQD